MKRALLLVALLLVVRAKTGNTTVGGENLSWLVGAVETAGRTYVFASRVRSREKLSSTAGAELAQRALNARLAAPKPRG